MIPAVSEASNKDAENLKASLLNIVHLQLMLPSHPFCFVCGCIKVKYYLYPTSLWCSIFMYVFIDRKINTICIQTLFGVQHSRVCFYHWKNMHVYSLI